MSSAKQRKTGEIAAAVTAAWLGMAATAVSNLWSVIDPLTANANLLKFGSWLPGWWRIGPFAGKETAGLLVWLFSWPLLHLLWRRRDISMKYCYYAFLIGFLVLTLSVWPPAARLVVGWPPATSE